MVDRVPGGRRSMDSVEIKLGKDAEGNVPDSQPDPKRATANEHLTSSQMLTDSSSAVGRSRTVDRKKVLRKPSIKSVGNFVNKVVRQVNSLTLKRKPRSSSLSRVDQSRENGNSQRVYTVTNSDGVAKVNGKIPGISGIRNHGNTCFMNAVLQCLSNTDTLAEYFVTDLYKEDVLRHNKSNAKKFGTKGELTEQFALLLKSIWSCQYSPDISNEFKVVVGRYGSQYKGYSQHDAQEFLLWLLDKVHEDLNIASKKKYRANKSSKGRSDEAVAAEALANHMRHNNSFIYELFQALYRSSLECPACHGRSTTFDPFLCVSLPIPQRLTRPVYVTVVYLDARPKQVRLGLSVIANATVKDLREMLALDIGVAADRLILCDIYYNGFHRTFHDTLPVSDINEADNVYAIEAPVLENGTGESEAGNLLLVVQNMQGAANQGKRFGSPVVLRVPRDCSHDDLHEDILHCMLDELKSSNTVLQESSLFRLRVVGGIQGKSYIPQDVELPLFTPTVEKALNDMMPNCGPPHLKLYADWEPQTKQQFLNNRDDVREEHSSVSQVKAEHQQPVLADLDQCFQLYTEEEKLGSEDAWRCANCKKQQQGTLKTLHLWTLPDILVIHLKRFKQTGVKRSKLNSLVNFPVCGLDMSSHVTRKSSADRHHLSPWRPHRHHHHNNKYIYDLYAVCNHYGNMQGGHYTAFCKNPANGLWYSFDDLKVSQLQESEIVSHAAYMLFYQRRSKHTTATPSGRHWIHHMPINMSLTPSKSSNKFQSQDNLIDSGTDLDRCNRHQDTPEISRNVQAYATIRRPTRMKDLSSSAADFAPLYPHKKSTDRVSEKSRSQSPEHLDNLSGSDSGHFSLASGNDVSKPASFLRTKSVDALEASQEELEIQPDQLYPEYSSLAETCV